MSWQTFQASFNNIPFHVTSFTNSNIGREVNIKHIADSSDYLVEDLRSLPKRFRIDAFVKGEDALATWFSLEKAFSARGVATFQHNYYQEPFKVYAVDGSLSVDDSEHETIKFSIELLLAGLEEFADSGSTSLQDFTNSASNLRSTASNYLNNNIRLNGVTGFARSAVTNSRLTFNNLLNGALTSARFTESLISGTGNLSFSNALTDFTSLVSNVPEFSTASSIFTSMTNIVDRFKVLSSDNKNYVNSITPYLEQEPESFPTSTPNMENYEENSRVTNNAQKILVLSEVAENIPEIEFESYEEAIAFRDDLSKTVINEIKGLDNESTIEVVQFINNINKHIPVAAEDLPNLITIEGVRGRNLADVLYRNLQSVDKLDDVIARNNIINPMVLEVDEINILES